MVSPSLRFAALPPLDMQVKRPRISPVRRCAISAGASLRSLRVAIVACEAAIESGAPSADVAKLRRKARLLADMTVDDLRNISAFYRDT